MALSTATYTSAKTSRNYSIRLTLTEDSTSVTNNTSSITYKLELLSEDWNFSQYGLGYSVTVNGTVVASLARADGPQISIAKNSSYTICTGTTTVTHDADGTKTITAANMSASIDMPLAGAGPGAISLTASSNWTLTTIARKSTLSISNGTLGSARSMSVTTQSSSFTHTLTYTCGSASATMFNKQAASAITSYTFPLTLAAQNTTGTSVSISLTLTTYSGNTSIGSNTYSITMTIPDNSTTKPTIGTITTGEPSGQSHISTYGGYVQSLSRMTVSFSPSGYQGATIRSATIKIGNMYTYSGTSVNPTGYLTTSGTVTITVTATDSRGFTNSATKNISVTAYSPPSISNVALTRTDSSGNALASGAYGTITFKATGTSLTGNGMTYKAYYRASTTSTYTSAQMTAYTNNYNVTNGKYTFSAATTSSWYAYITVQDMFNVTTSTVVFMPSEAVFFNINAANNAISIGTIESTQNVLRVGWDAVFNEDVLVSGSLTNTAKYSKFNYQPYSWEAQDSNNTAGYMLVARIQVNEPWADGQIKVSVARRMDLIPVNLYVKFQQSSSSDPGIYAFCYDSLSGTDTTTPFEAFIVKSSTSIWDIYVRKQQENDNWMTVWVQMSGFMQYRCHASLVNYHLNAIPSGAYVASPMYYAATPRYPWVFPFAIPGNSSKRVTASGSNPECAWLVTCTGWNTNIRDGLYYLSGYSDSSRAKVTTISAASSIVFTAISGSLGWTITNNSVTQANMTLLILYGTYPIIS